MLKKVQLQLSSQAMKNSESQRRGAMPREYFAREQLFVTERESRAVGCACSLGGRRCWHVRVALHVCVLQRVRVKRENEECPQMQQNYVANSDEPCSWID